MCLQCKTYTLTSKDVAARFRPPYIFMNGSTLTERIGVHHRTHPHQLVYGVFHPISCTYLTSNRLLPIFVHLPQQIPESVLLPLPTLRRFRQQIPRLQPLIGRMSQRPLSLHLHLMSSTVCMLPAVLWPENHLDCVGDDDEHDCDEALD
jgi:hypothetical protein